MTADIQIDAVAEPWQQAIAIRIRHNNRVVAGFTYQDVPKGSFTEPSARMTPEDAQFLADALWAAGIRPSQGKQSEGVTAAQGRHLEDMRALAFHKIGVERP